MLFAAPRTLADSKLIRALMTYHNIYLRNLDMVKYAERSPIEQLITSGRFTQSRFFSYHLSDILRFLTLWKYGGSYLDMDVIVTKNLETLGQNYAIAENVNALSSSGVNFSPTGPGHEVVGKCLQELEQHFNGRKWNSNGPALLTNVLRKMCGLNKTEPVESFESCSPMKILSKNLFLPIDWKWNSILFNSKKVNQVLKAANESYSVHIYNHLNYKRKIKKGSNVPYEVLAKQYCPRVYEAMDETW